MKYEPKPESKEAAVADLARTGRWVNIAVFSTRMEWGRSKSLAVLQSLMRDGLVEMQDVPSKIRGIGAERQYRLRDWMSAQNIPESSHRERATPPRRNDFEDRIYQLVITRGTTTAPEVAAALSISQPTARGALARLAKAGRLFRYVGPAPEVGSQRPWCYEPQV